MKKLLSLLILLSFTIKAQDVTIGTQTWTSKNLNVSTYRNGDKIPQVQDAKAWEKLTTGAWCYYENKTANGTTYGKLYNWYAVNDARGLAPTGYHIPSEEEWMTLSDYLGGKNKAGGKMQSIPSLYSDGSFIISSSNSSRFTGLMGGTRGRDYYGADYYYGIGSTGIWWSSSETSEKESIALSIHSPSRKEVGNSLKKDRIVAYTGNSVRCLRDAKEIRIGDQTWTNKNLDISTYRNGDTIPEVKDANAWAKLTTGAWCYYENDSNYGTKHGKLYNWYAVNDARGLAPNGYHIPSDAEWTILSEYLGGQTVAGSKMKSSCGWDYLGMNVTGTNTCHLFQSGFAGIPGGNRNSRGKFRQIGKTVKWWSSSEQGAPEAWYRSLSYDNSDLSRRDSKKIYGYFVRCLKDNQIVNTQTTPAINTQKINLSLNIGDECIKIGDQIWTTKNLDVSTFRNGDTIPEVIKSKEWSLACYDKQPAWCYYETRDVSGQGYIGNSKLYGKLYNWYAVNDPRGLAPKGFHIPTDAEWTTLADYLGGESKAGTKMKSTMGQTRDNPDGWYNNSQGTNSSGFDGLPGGDRGYHGYFNDLGRSGRWWSTSVFTISDLYEEGCWYRELNYVDFIGDYTNSFKQSAFSVRCIKD